MHDLDDRSDAGLHHAPSAGLRPGLDVIDRREKVGYRLAFLDKTDVQV
jgi:hypothetical protein